MSDEKKQAYRAPEIAAHTADQLAGGSVADESDFLRHWDAVNHDYGFHQEYDTAYKAARAAWFARIDSRAALAKPVAAGELLDALWLRIKEMQEASYTYGEHSKEAVGIALDGVLDEIEKLEKQCADSRPAGGVTDLSKLKQDIYMVEQTMRECEFDDQQAWANIKRATTLAASAPAGGVTLDLDAIAKAACEAVTDDAIEDEDIQENEKFHAGKVAGILRMKSAVASALAASIAQPGAEPVIQMKIGGPDGCVWLDVDAFTLEAHKMSRSSTESRTVYLAAAPAATKGGA